MTTGYGGIATIFSKRPSVSLECQDTTEHVPTTESRLYEWSGFAILSHGGKYHNRIGQASSSVDLVCADAATGVRCPAGYVKDAFMREWEQQKQQ